MSYIENSLSRDEGNVVIFKFHWLRWLWFFIWIVLTVASLALVFIGNFMVALMVALPFALLSVYEYFKLRSIEMGVTNKRVVYKEGIISRKTQEMKLNAIENITIEQTFFQRIIDVGTVKVVGRAATPVFFTEVSAPLAVKKAIENEMPLLSAEREDQDPLKK